MMKHLLFLGALLSTVLAAPNPKIGHDLKKEKPGTNMGEVLKGFSHVIRNVDVRDLMSHIDTFLKREEASSLEIQRGLENLLKITLDRLERDKAVLLEMKLIKMKEINENLETIQQQTLDARVGLELIQRVTPAAIERVLKEINPKLKEIMSALYEGAPAMVNIDEYLGADRVESSTEKILATSEIEEDGSGSGMVEVTSEDEVVSSGDGLEKYEGRLEKRSSKSKLVVSKDNEDTSDFDEEKLTTVTYEEEGNSNESKVNPKTVQDKEYEMEKDDNEEEDEEENQDQSEGKKNGRRRRNKTNKRNKEGKRKKSKTEI